MSTVTLNYPDVIRVRRVPAIGQVLILCSLALIGIAILLTVISANADLAYQVAVSQNATVPVPIPVATPLTENTQPVPSETRAPTSRLASRLSILPIPVPTPPSQ